MCQSGYGFACDGDGFPLDALDRRYRHYPTALIKQKKIYKKTISCQAGNEKSSKYNYTYHAHRPWKLKTEASLIPDERWHYWMQGTRRSFFRFWIERVSLANIGMLKLNVLLFTSPRSTITCFGSPLTLRSTKQFLCSWAIAVDGYGWLQTYQWYLIGMPDQKDPGDGP